MVNMKNLKISQKLMLGIAAQLVFIALLVFFISWVNSKLDFLSRKTTEGTGHIEEVKKITSLSKDFISDKITYKDLNNAFSNIIQKNTTEAISETLTQIRAKLKKINELKIDNQNIETQVMQLTDNSLE